MSHVHEHAAIRIVDWLHRAENSLIGRSVVTFSCESNIVKGVRLDDFHGLCFTFDDPSETRRWHPVSTIKELDR